MRSQCSSLTFVNFREAETSDIEAISALFLRCWHNSYKSILNVDARESMTASSSQNMWTDALSKNPGRVTIMGYVDNVLVGFFRCGPDKNDAKRGHLYSLYVDPDSAGRGFGKELMSKAVENIMNRGFKVMSLWVFEGNIPARTLYEKFSFMPTGNTRVTPEWGATEIEMVNLNINE